MLNKQAKNTAKVAAQWWGERLQKGDRALFEKTLEKLIRKALKKRSVIFIENDYDPRDILLEAVQKTIDPNISGVMFSGRGVFPDKHALVVRSGLIEPKEGYGNWTNSITVN